MAKFSLYLDEDNETEALFLALQRAGMHVVRCREAGLTGRPDPEHLAFAAQAGHVLYTSNASDFAPLHRSYMESGLVHAGILIRYGRRFSVGEQAKRILRLWETLTAEDMANRTESLSQWGDDRDS